MTRNRIVLVVLVAAMVAGCGRNVGWVLKPVSLTEELTETVLRADPGLFVGDKIALVDLSGLIVNDRDEGIFSGGENPVSLFVEKIDKAQDDPAVKAMVLRINSPGGGVTASDILHRRVKKFREEKKVPVVAVLEDVAASGGYYVACAADTIVAHPTTITGSIGVIVQTVSFADTMKKLGISADAVTSGPRKDMASPLKPLDLEDRKLIQAMVDEFYGRFVDVVAASRSKLSREQVKALADGRVYTGEQARKLGLVDNLADVDEAVALAKTRSGSKAVKVVMYHRPLGYRANAYSSLSMPAQINLVNLSVPGLLDLTRPRFLYLWTGRTFE